MFALTVCKIRDSLQESLPNFDFDFGKLHGAANYSRKIEAICWQLWREAEQENLHGNLYADGLLLQLVAELLYQAELSKSTRRAQPLPNLSAKVLCTVLEYIDSHCDDQLSVEILANLTGMPQAFFIAPSKAVLGKHPFNSC